jgi:FeS assembly SUF system protein
MSELNQSEAGAAGAGTDAASPSADAALPLRDRVENVLRTVYDPEIPVNIFDLGLVYEISIGDNGAVKITMTLTAPACPAAGEIIHDVQSKVGAVEGVSDCHVQLTFEPAWTKDMMTEEAKLELGFM